MRCQKKVRSTMNSQQCQDLEQLTALLADPNADVEELDQLYLRLISGELASIARAINGPGAVPWWLAWSRSAAHQGCGRTSVLPVRGAGTWGWLACARDCIGDSRLRPAAGVHRLRQPRSEPELLPSEPAGAHSI